MLKGSLHRLLLLLKLDWILAYLALYFWGWTSRRWFRIANHQLIDRLFLSNAVVRHTPRVFLLLKLKLSLTPQILHLLHVGADDALCVIIYLLNRLS